jgi:polysaccharide biosynthesis/export protein
MRLTVCGIVFVLGLVLPPIAHGQGTAAMNGTDASALEEFRIGPEDTLQISVWRNEAMSKTIPVRPDGMISLPLLNEVKAAGLTPAELRQVIATKLA